MPLPDRAAHEIAKAIGDTIRFIQNCKFLRPFQGCLVRRIVSDQGTEFMNQTLQSKAEEWGVHWATSPAYQPASNGVAERMIGLAKTIVRRLFASELESKYWSYALLHGADVLRYRSVKLPYPHPVFGETVGIWRSQDKDKVKALEPRGARGRFLGCDSLTKWNDVDSEEEFNR